MAVHDEGEDLYPSTLLEGAGYERSDRRWWVLRTKARLEKALARELLAENIAFYSPLTEKTSVHLGRTITSRLPVFPGHVFIFAHEDERAFALATRHVVRSLPVHAQGALYRELKHLRRLIESGKPVVVERRLLPGTQVRVDSGPLEGAEGTVLAEGGQTRLVVGVTCLQCGASVEIEEPTLQPVG